ncbi:DUF3068 domain-containing protein [Actinomadura parmotrematis]|uniref:DUF3068 domain-containing protein n=1 Tax=Actinomadura parmotrematis TaxID=2864039 RepID=A0ABS7G7G5_9ACTN|nr:DUF3068 domain-containing protein [Actinomadura parmotrematis]MBW8487568.1 DUF3068 domain-containing protein [Actinomadura parmotrematis]
MRRPAALILIGLGAFFLALAPLCRFYVAGQVVQAPLDQYQETHLEAQNATYFDQATLKARTGVTMVADNTVRGDVRGNNGNQRIAVWEASTVFFDKAQPDKQVDIQKFRIAFDRRTGALVNCCSVNMDGDSDIQLSGYGLLFPLADVRKRDYTFYDTTTKQALPMKYDGTDKVEGLATYRFVQQVPETKVAKVDYKVPGELLGLGKKSDAETVDRYFSATITVWVDPRTGVPVKHDQKINSTVRTPDGQGRMTVAAADLVTIPADQKKLVDVANDSAFKIAMVRSRVPIGSLALGVLLLLAGAGVGVLGSRRAASAPPAPRRADGKFGAAPEAPAGPPKPPPPPAPPARRR